MSIHRTRRPTHPGAILREDLLPSARLSQMRLAQLLGVSRRTVNEVIRERRSVTIDLAHRLSRVFGTTPEFWLNLQQAVDLWDAMEAHMGEYARIKSLKQSAA